jgi:hypothetical protein
MPHYIVLTLTMFQHTRTSSSVPALCEAHVYSLSFLAAGTLQCLVPLLRPVVDSVFRQFLTNSAKLHSNTALLHRKDGPNQERGLKRENSATGTTAISFSQITEN